MNGLLIVYWIGILVDVPFIPILGAEVKFSPGWMVGYEMLKRFISAKSIL